MGSHAGVILFRPKLRNINEMKGLVCVELPHCPIGKAILSFVKSPSTCINW